MSKTGSLAGLLLLAMVCAGCSQGSDGPGVVLSSNPDPWSDRYNVYRYLKTASGDCLYQGEDCSALQAASVTQFKSVHGFNGIQYGTGETTDIDIDRDGIPDGVVKYSGNLATYTAKHSPSAVRRGLFTYFTYSGEVPLDGVEAGSSRIGTTGTIDCVFEGSSQFKSSQGVAPALGIYVSRYNHVTGRVAPPVLVHMKCTNDTHDNAVINLDADGYVYVLVSGRAVARGNFVFRSAEPDSIDGFIDVTPAMDDYLDYLNDLAEAVTKRRLLSGVAYRGINYPKMFWVDDPDFGGRGYFRLVYTIYCGVIEGSGCTGSRQLYTARMHVAGGEVSIEGIKPLAAYLGHYAIANGRGRDIVVAFNVHPDWKLDNRTNLYYLHSVDGGETWLNARNQAVRLPLVSSMALEQVAVREYYEPHYLGAITQRIYLKDIGFTGAGHSKTPTILFVGSLATDHLPSTTADHYLATERWIGTGWRQQRLTSAVDHNYSSGMLAPSGDGYRVFYPHTDEARNNALAGGAVAYLDIDATGGTTGSAVLITDDVVDPGRGSGNYLADLCEFNYIKPVLQGSDDFAGIMSGGNPYQYERNAPLFIVDLNGGVYRLPTAFEDDDLVDGEVGLERVIRCSEGAD